jgi:hypothetical protein
VRVRARGSEWTCVRIWASASRSSVNARGMRDVHRLQKQNPRSLHPAQFVRPVSTCAGLNWHAKKCVMTMSRFVPNSLPHSRRYRLKQFHVFLLHRDDNNRLRDMRPVGSVMYVRSQPARKYRENLQTV